MPRLVVVPTPIGNLDDITLRALAVLGSASLILAEDTRHTRRLLAHHKIRARLVSYHQHNKRERIQTALAALDEGDVALVSDAGMPVIADPGFELVRAAIDAGAEIDVLPGASAVITAVVGAALPSQGFLFFGFLPRRGSERRESLRMLAAVEQTLVFYEAPHRVVPALQDMHAVLGDREMVLARELTKLHQEWVRGTISDICHRYAEAAPRGELTLVVAGAPAVQSADTSGAEDLLRALHAAGVERKAAVAAAARLHGIGRNEAYRLWLALAGEGAADSNNRE